eukprot:CAMPEP_0181040388 /NCGR_PEP_ID=MMETSP1070-20121207/11020_1 /TAXON_ID=265543 /ORGANISM="Minutocellus polymorphus, Strain NH13" /LENGTH=224 /DNA_ID=CAMNT_0023118391 /DNA_START=68 /DNA_END=740 /DNA_ORIENTATION=+
MPPPRLTSVSMPSNMAVSSTSGSPRARIERAKKINARPARTKKFRRGTSPTRQVVLTQIVAYFAEQYDIVMTSTVADPAPDATASRRSRRSGQAIPCFEYFVRRSGIIDASTMRGQTPGMIETIANRAWAELSPQRQLGVIVQAREEELRRPAASLPDAAHDMPIVQTQIARGNSSSDSADVSPEPMMEDNAGIAARPDDSNMDVGGDSEPMYIGGRIPLNWTW